jgi:hypothetical protein
LTLNIIAVTPSTKAIFAIFDPIALPNAILLLPSNTALRLTNSSGAEVAKDTTVIPTTKVDIFIIRAKDTDPLTRNSPPKNNKTKPNNSKIIGLIIALY